MIDDSECAPLPFPLPFGVLYLQPAILHDTLRFIPLIVLFLSLAPASTDVVW
jgi:hypothetical protein